VLKKGCISTSEISQDCCLYFTLVHSFKVAIFMYKVFHFFLNNDNYYIGKAQSGREKESKQGP
jgi:hypothetical protein